MSETIIRQAVLETVTCCRCAVLFAVPANMLQRLKDTGESFWCPSGHSQHFTKTTQQRLEEELARARKQTEWANAAATAARDQAEATERSNRALRGVNTRMKRRIAAGVCPCCKRSFKDLARHMSGQHPKFVGEQSGASS